MSPFLSFKKKEKRFSVKERKKAFAISFALCGRSLANKFAIAGIRSRFVG